MSEAVKNSGIFSTGTLVPVGLVVTILPAVMFFSQMAQRVNTLESTVQSLQAQSITKEVFSLEMKVFNGKLDAVLEAVGQKNKGK